MVVDDDPGVLLLAEEVFEAKGYTVACFESGEAALSRLEDVRPNMILLDLMMPGIDGFQTCERIRRTTSFRHTPIIVLTGREDADAVDKAYQVGAWDFASKPINWPLLEHRVHYGLRSSQAFSAERRAARLSKTLDSSSNEILEFDAQTFQLISANPSARQNLVMASADVNEVHISSLIASPSENKLAALLVSLASHQQVEVKLKMRRSDASTYPAEGIILFNADEQPHSYICILQDVSGRENAEKELYRLAFYDELTGLPNRRLFKDYVHKAVALANRDRTACALCILDLDGFKQINDALGHSVGDLLLKQVSDRLSAEVRQHDVVSRDGSLSGFEDLPSVNLARFGGDEFLLLLSNFEDSAVPARISSRVLKSLALPYNVHGQELNITASIGIALCPEDGDSLDVLMRHADSAMYSAKNAGKNNYSYYSREKGKTSLERLTLESQLRRAPEREELKLFYQPQIDGVTGKLIGVEALVRWDHPELGLLYPNSFVPIAEESGLIIPVGEWILHQALSQLKRWTSTPFHDLKCAVNISGLQLRQDEFLTTTRRGLLAAQFPKNRLVFELTESAIMSNAQSRINWLNAIKQMGVEVSIDDFGTGYSSLSYLKKFPIDYLKIDRSFVIDLGKETDDRVIVSTIFSMAQALGLRVVAEGVETVEQLRVLSELGECAIQGYLISKALPLEAFEKFAHAYDPNAFVQSHHPSAATA